MSEQSTPEEPSPIKRLINLITGKKTSPLKEIIASPESKEIASSIAEVYELRAEDVTIPRADIVAIEANATPKEVGKILSKNPHSYYPVFSSTMDNLMGIFSARQYIQAIENLDNFVLRENIAEAMIVAPSTPVLDILDNMRAQGQRIAIVADEFGGVDGIITAEDIVEKVIGRFAEAEYEDEEPYVEELPDGSIKVSGRVTLEEFEDRYGKIFSNEVKDEDIDTMGGLVFYIAGRVPTRGEIIPYENGTQFQILDCNARYIKSILLRNLPKKDPS